MNKAKILFFIVSIFLMSSHIYASSDTNQNALAQKALERWQQNMKYGISKQRLSTIKDIEDNHSQQAYYLIKDALVNDKNAQVRAQAVYTLIDLKIKDKNVWFPALRKEKDSEVLRREVFAISELKIDGAGPYLMTVLSNYSGKSKDQYLTAATIRALGDIAYKPASEKVFTILTNLKSPTELRSAAAEAMGTLGNANILDYLKNLAENPGEEKAVRMYSAYALGKSGNSKYIDTLFNIINNEKEEVYIRLWAIAGLAFIKDPKVTDALINLCKVDNKQIRGKAVETLGKLKDPKAKDILSYKALHDPEFSVMRAARKALQNMGVDVSELGKKKKGKTKK